MKKPKGLGRGLEALLGGSPDFIEEAPNVSGAPPTLPLSALQAGKYQPRIKMDQSAINELADSIRKQGLLQAILVRPIKNGPPGVDYEIIAGERRFRASKLAGLTEVLSLIHI